MSAHPPRGFVCPWRIANPQLAGRDPHLTSRYAAAFVRGLQEGEDPRFVLVAATFKHAVANSLEGKWDASGAPGALRGRSGGVPGSPLGGPGASKPDACAQNSTGSKSDLYGSGTSAPWRKELFLLRFSLPS